MRVTPILMAVIKVQTELLLLNKTLVMMEMAAFSVPRKIVILKLV
jgi:hypothetical protein